MSLAFSPVPVSKANPQMPALMVKPDENPTKISKNCGDSDVKKLPWTKYSMEIGNLTSRFSLGMVIHSTQASDRHISSISKPASSCSLSFLVVLQPDETEHEESIQHWIKNNNISKDVTVRWGEAGLSELLESDVNAVYLIVEAE